MRKKNKPLSVDTPISEFLKGKYNKYVTKILKECNILTLGHIVCFIDSSRRNKFFNIFDYRHNLYVHEIESSLLGINVIEEIPYNAGYGFKYEIKENYVGKSLDFEINIPKPKQIQEDKDLLENEQPIRFLNETQIMTYKFYMGRNYKKMSIVEIAEILDRTSTTIKKNLSICFDLINEYRNVY